MRTALLVPVLLLLIPPPIARSADPLEIGVRGERFVHSVFAGGEHLFRAADGEAGATRWERRVTVRLNESARDARALAEWVGQIRGARAREGKIVRAERRGDEYRVIALAKRADGAEATLTRVAARDGHARAVTYARREYGARAAARLLRWLQRESPALEEALGQSAAWPALARLRELEDGRGAGRALATVPDHR
jgi:hypothetical protein